LGLYTEKPLAFQHASENLRFPDVNSGTAFPAGFLPARKAPSFNFRGDLSGPASRGLKAWEGAWGLYTEKPLAFQH